MSKSDDLIRRSDAIEAARTAKAVFDTTLEPYIKPQYAVDALSALPSAEAVEVVRCKDCIRTKERDEYTGRLWCSIHRGYMEDTYYCADGLRREDGEA